MSVFDTSGPLKPFILVVLIAGLLLNGSTSFIGLAVVRFDSKPTFSLDICHPLQPGESTAGVTLNVPEPAFALHPIFADFGTQMPAVFSKIKDRSDPPDLPPPK